MRGQPRQEHLTWLYTRVCQIAATCGCGLENLYFRTLYLQAHTKVVVYLLVISPSRNPERIRLSYQYWYYLLVQHLATSLLL